MRRHRKDHAHVKGFTVVSEFLNHRHQGVGTNRMLRAAIFHLRNIRQHHFPNFVADGNAVTIQVHGKRCHDMSLGAVANGGRERLTSEHVGTIQLTVDHTVQKDLPVCLRFKRDK